MIGSIFSTSPSIHVNGGTSSTYINGYSGAQGVGNMRYNTSSQKTEVFDGSNWITLNLASVSVGLSQDTESLLEWARKKRSEEWELEQLMKDSPAIKDLVDQINQKKEQIKMVKTLIKKESEYANEGVQAGP